MGLSISLQQEPDYTVWPCNWSALNAFIRVYTQWRYAASGRCVGLDYGALAFVLEAMQTPSVDRLDVLDSVRVLEAQILDLVSQS